MSDREDWMAVFFKIEMDVLDAILCSSFIIYFLYFSSAVLDENPENI